MVTLHKLNTVAELERLLNSVREIKLYGAGYYLDVFLQEMEKLDEKYQGKIACIMVSTSEGNPVMIKDIPVKPYQKAGIARGDIVLLTLGHRYTEDVYNLLQNTDVDIIQLDFNMFQEKQYWDVKASIQPFIDSYPEKVSGLNEPTADSRIIAWTCWWQGEEQMPEIVDACIRSQRRNLPSGVEHVIITKSNYMNYIALPEYILEKAECGNICLAHLTDIIRVALLYKYGGFWMDATLLVLKPFEENIMDLPIYTRSLPETQYCANAMWATWFWYAKAGNELFQFVMESFFYYISMYDRFQYYFTFDYFIAIACNTFLGVEKQLQKIPYNNEKAQELVKHLMESYDQQRFSGYIKGSSIQKLTYKLGRTETNKKGNTIYEYIVNVL